MNKPTLMGLGPRAAAAAIARPPRCDRIAALHIARAVGAFVLLLVGGVLLEQCTVANFPGDAVRVTPAVSATEA